MASRDRDALVALYHATGGAECWKKSENWNTNDDISTWFGVTVNAEGRVVELTLRGNNLQGMIIFSLANMGLSCTKTMIVVFTHGRPTDSRSCTTLLYLHEIFDCWRT